MSKKLRTKSVKSVPAPVPAPVKARYYITFIEDPGTRTPFAVVPASKIADEAEAAIAGQYLNTNRRKRSYPVAVCPLFKFPCRIFAKAESNVTVVRLNKLVTTLNEKHKLLSTHVDLETSYASLLADCPNKVKEGIEFFTGAVTNKRARKSAPPDTTSSYTDTDDHHGDIDNEHGGGNNVDEVR